MKILVLSLYLLFLNGTYGSPVSTQAEHEPQHPQRPAIRDSIKNLLHNGLVFGAELVSHWDSSEADRQADLAKRVQIMKNNYFDLAYGLSDYLGEIFKEVHKEINETYPVYNNKVLPLLAVFMVQVVDGIRTTAEEIQPYFEKFEEKVKVHQLAFWEEIFPILQKKTKPIIEALNANLKPLIEDVHKEVEAAKAKEHGIAGQDTTDEYAEENYKLAEKIQKVLLFERDVLKKMTSQLGFFSANA